MNKYQKRLLKSVGLFLFLLLMGVLSIILGFTVIHHADTIVIEEMSGTDWTKAITGASLVLSSFFWLGSMSLVGKVK